MVRIKVTVDKKRAIKKLRNLDRQVAVQGEATVSDLGKIGKNYAKSRVYYDTGKTFRSIRRRTLKTSKGAQARIFVEPYLREDGHNRNMSNFSLVRWSHTAARARAHFKSGDPKFLYTTRNYLNKIKKGVARGKFKNINIK